MLVCSITSTAPGAHVVGNGTPSAVLDCALAQLDVTERLILRLRFEDAVSVPEIARLLGIDSPFKVYRQLDKVLMTVRRHLEAAGIHDAST